MIRAMSAVVVAGLVLPATAGAQVWDIEAYCRQVADSVGGSYVIEKGCRQQEADAKNAMAAQDVPKRIADWCTEVASSVGGSYVIYQGCVQQELQAKGELN